MPEITKELFENLKYDSNFVTPNANAVPATTNNMETSQTSVMFIFDNSDLSAAAYHLAQSLSEPFSVKVVVSVFVQESIREEFLDQLRPLLKAYNDDVANNETFKKSVQIIQRLQAVTIRAPSVDISKSPLLVSDVLQQQFGNLLSGVVTLHTFRTAKEAIALAAKETLPAANASIWSENHSSAYEVAVAAQYSNIFINCFAVNLDPLKGQAVEGGNMVAIENNYHYETLNVNGVQKSIVFPIGTIFAN